MVLAVVPLVHDPDQRGLSDTVPVLPHARSLVVIEMMAGVLYVALVVARLVGMAVIRRDRPS